MKTYKIRKFQNGKNKDGQPFINYSLTIPSHIAENLPADKHFECVLTEDGILFRPVTPIEEQITLPSWAQAQAAANGKGDKPKAKSSQPRKRPSRAKAKPKAEQTEAPAEQPAEGEPVEA